MYHQGLGHMYYIRGTEGFVSVNIRGEIAQQFRSVQFAMEYRCVLDKLAQFVVTYGKSIRFISEGGNGKCLFKCKI